MNKKGPIIVIEDDPDDRDLLKEILSDFDCRNEVQFFADGLSAIKHLRKDEVQPFLILSDINLPLLNGLEVKLAIQEDAALNAKCFPYLFMSTSTNPMQIRKAYSLSIQGYFGKPVQYTELRKKVHAIVEYWMYAEQ